MNLLCWFIIYIVESCTFYESIIIYIYIAIDYCQVSNISSTLGNNIVDHPDVVEVSPVGAVPTTPSFLT